MGMCCINDFTFVESIGAGPLSYFFQPFTDVGLRSPESYSSPLLSYVTDSEKNVIYEGYGGVRLWEIAGVENVSVDDYVPIEWFTIQGIRIDKPCAPGIYIRRQGRHASKFCVK